MKNRVLLIVFVLVLFLIGCAAGMTNEEVYDKAYDALVASLDRGTLRFDVRYTIMDGDEGIISDFAVWKDAADVYVENIEDLVVTGGKLRTGGMVYSYTAETDAWQIGEDSGEEDIFAALLEMYRNAEVESLTWTQTWDEYQVVCTCSVADDDRGASALAYYSVTLEFDKDWNLVSYLCAPAIDSDEIGDMVKNESMYPLKTEVVFLDTDSAEIREVIDEAIQKATTDQK